MEGCHNHFHNKSHTFFNDSLHNDHDDSFDKSYEEITSQAKRYDNDHTSILVIISMIIFMVSSLCRHCFHHDNYCKYVFWIHDKDHIIIFIIICSMPFITLIFGIMICDDDNYEGTHDRIMSIMMTILIIMCYMLSSQIPSYELSHWSW